MRLGRLFMSVALAAGAVVALQPAVAQAVTPTYYLALGESLAHGYAAAPGLGYTNDLLAYLKKATQ